MSKHNYKRERRLERGLTKQLLGSATDAINLADGIADRDELKQFQRIEKAEHPEFH